MKILVAIIFVFSTSICFAQIPVTDVATNMTLTRMHLQNKIDAAKSEVKAQTRFMQSLKQATDMAKYGMQTLGTAKQIYQSSMSAVQMMKSAFGDFKSMGDLMAVYTMGQLKLMNLHNEWQREHSTFTDYNLLYLQATQRYRFGGKMDPYALIEAAYKDGVSVTSTTRKVLGMQMEMEQRALAQLLRDADKFDERANAYDEIANKLAFYMAFATVGGPNGDISKWIEATSKLAVDKNSILLENSASGAQSIMDKLNGNFGKAVKNEMEKYAEKNNISAQKLEDLDKTIRDYRDAAAKDRQMARDLRRTAYQENGYYSIMGSMALAREIMLEDPILSIIDYK